MKTSRLIALPAVAAAALLTMTGCFQLPGQPTSTPTTPGTTTAPTDGGGGGGTEEGTDLAGTSWTGDFNGQVTDMAFTLNQDGTVDFTSWAGSSFDSPGDVWTQSGDSLEMTITQILVGEASSETFDVDLSGSVSGGTMTLSGTGTDGNSYQMTASQG